MKFSSLALLATIAASSVAATIATSTHAASLLKRRATGVEDNHNDRHSAVIFDHNEEFERILEEESSRLLQEGMSMPINPPQPESNGDPHFRTWKDEHFEFHGQCDVVFSKTKDFAGPGKDLDIHLRTSMVRYWSYIKTVAIRIGNDILEVEGSAAKENGVDKRHYRINYEYRGSLEDGIGGFPVSITPNNNIYTIDLNSKFPGQMIQIKTFKEFVGVKIIGANQESFGDSVGIIGDFNTGKTLARDGHTVLNDFNELGLEWQVLPCDGKLFHEMTRPQFPELCYLPEDPRGERARRLAESDITEEAAEAACAGLKDEFDRKGCIYDILATQDMDMVGAY